LRSLTRREYLALGIALFLTIPSIASIIIAIRFIGRMLRPSDFMLHYGAVSLLAGLAAAFFATRLLPKPATPGSNRSIRQGIAFLTALGTAALLLGLFSVMNAVLDRSEGTIENAVVVQKDRRHFYKGRASYVTVSIFSIQKEFMVTAQQFKSLDEGKQVQLLLRKGFFGYEHIEKIIASDPPGMTDEEEDLPS